MLLYSRDAKSSPIKIKEWQVYTPLLDMKEESPSAIAWVCQAEQQC